MLRASVSSVLCAIGLLFAGCGASPSPTDHSTETAPSTAEPTDTPADRDLEARTDAPRRVDLALDTPNGLSGLTRTPDGTLWAIAEADRVLVRIVDDRVAEIIPLQGVPDGLDTESIAWLGDGRFILGTESMDAARVDELLLVVQVALGVARVVETITVPYAAIGGAADENEGVEAICHVEGAMLVATEHCIVDDAGVRHATLALRDDATGAWRPFELALTTETGKISGMDCRRRGSVLEVFAIERHYAVIRVLRFELDANAQPTRPPTVAVDLAGVLDNDPNLEGLIIGDGELIAVVDNHYGHRTGPNELVHLPGRVDSR